MILAGDIGGTKTILALFSPEQGPRQAHLEKSFPSQRFDSLETIVSQFMANKSEPVTGAAFGIAGPVSNGRARTTNLPWLVEASALAGALNLPAQRVRLLNDLEAIATAIPLLEPEDRFTLHEGQPVAGRPIGVVAPGTGLGEAYLTWDGRRYRAHSTEGGHSGFSPETELELELLIYMRRRFRRVSFERVCSGMGIPNLFDFLRDSGRYPVPAELASELAEAGDPAPIIANKALAGDDGICGATMELFVRILGSEAGNMVLNLGALAGVYLGGGIPPRILPLLQKPAFREAFCDKGRFANMLAAVPVHVILNPRMALTGAACYGLDNLAD